MQTQSEMTTEVELLLIRGLPGSGKTTMAKKYAQAGYEDAANELKAWKQNKHH